MQLRRSLGEGAMNVRKGTAVAATVALLAGAAFVVGSSARATTTTFVSSGSFPVPAGVTQIQVEAFGARGGETVDANGDPLPPPGEGARVITPAIPVTPGESLTITIGGRGNDGVLGGAKGTGGSGGGGDGGIGDGAVGQGGGGGGGASRVLRGATSLVIAGGGGGAGAPAFTVAGAGGGSLENGIDGADDPSAGGGGGGGGAVGTTGGTGGTAGTNGVSGGPGLSAGSGGDGGNAANATGGGGGGGGGGGRAGGGGGGGGSGGGGGGGGSSFGPAGSAFLTGVDANNGGNGKVVITYALPGEATPTPTPTPTPTSSSSPSASPSGNPSGSAPDTSITSNPHGKTKDRTPEFRFASDKNERPVRVQGRRRGVRAVQLAARDGELERNADHTFSVRAIDAEGIADPSPASETFRVLKKKKRHRG